MDTLLLKKKCWDCGRTKPLDEFHSDPSKRDGRNGRCKPCKLAYQRRLYKGRLR